MPRDPIERAVTLGADPHFTVPDLRGLAERTVRLPEQRLLATYLDTPDRRLWARQMTLRHRVGEGVGRGRWTLALPGPAPGPPPERTELEWAGPLDSMPDRVGELLRGIVRRAPLQRVASLETTRRRLVLQGGRQRPLAELDDDLVTIHGGPGDGARFRQIGLDLDGADHALVEQCVDRLRHAGAWVDDPGATLARALDAGATGDGSRPSPGPASTIGDVVRGSIRAGLDGILDHDALLRLGEDDPSPRSVHQARVAARRLRSDLRTFRSTLDPLWVRHTRHDLQWLGGALGVVRDADVLGDHLGLSGPGATGEPKGHAGLRQGLRHQRRGAARQLGEVLQDERYLLLLDKLHAAGERPPFLAGGDHPRRREPGRKASRALPGMVEGPWRTLRREVRRAGREPTDAQLHQIRIRAKQLRYAAEAAAPVVGKRARRTARAAEALQTQLGEHHDAVVAEEWLRRQARGASSKVAFTAGRLSAEQSRRQGHLRKGWPTRWTRLDRRARAWLG